MKKLTIALLLIVASTAAWAGDERGLGLTITAEVNQVRGAWKATLTPGEGGPPPFAMLLVLTRDGGVVETDAGPPNPQQFSPGIGEWKLTEDGRYAINYTQLEFDAGQNHIGVFRGLLDVAFDLAKGTFTGNARVRFYDLDDVLLFEGEGTIEGRRMPVE